MIILIDIICQPNPRNLFLRFKERIDGKPEWENNFIYAGNNVGCSFKLEKEMINIFKSLDEEKRRCLNSIKYRSKYIWFNI